jgi:hypothetical protein
MDENVQTFFAVMLTIVCFLGALSVIGIGIHAYVQSAKRKMIALRQGPNMIGASDDRLLRLEQAVDSIAVEVERISEGQRFLTKLQTEREPRAIER